MIWYLPIPGRESDGINTKVVCGAENSTEVARVKYFVKHKNEGVAPLGVTAGYGAGKIILFYWFACGMVVLSKLNREGSLVRCHGTESQDGYFGKRDTF